MVTFLTEYFVIIYRISHFGKKVKRIEHFCKGSPFPENRILRLNDRRFLWLLFCAFPGTDAGMRRYAALDKFIGKGYNDTGKRIFR